MNRLDVFWLQRPDEDEEDSNITTHYRAMRFRLTDGWVATDADQLVLPVSIIWRTEDDGMVMEYDGLPGLLKQYGGERLLNDLLLADQEPKKGTEWVLEYYPASGFTVTHSAEYEPPVEWLAGELANED